MKKTSSIIIVLASIFLLVACGGGGDVSSSSDISSQTSTSDSSSIVDDETIIDFYGINDFHGAIETSRSGVTLGQTATYLKARKKEGAILISSGDMWQGSILSNHNNGALVTKAFKNIGFDALTIGNHEFDFTSDVIRNNEVIYGEQFLGCNIMDYPKSGSSYVKASITDSSKIIYANKGTNREVKIGVIGAIPSAQQSSITSLNTKDVIFVDETPIIKEESEKLRMQGCEIIIGSYHAGQSSVDRSLLGGDYGLTTKYLDAVFCAHTHATEKSMVNGVPLVQAGGYGGNVAKISLKFNLTTRKLVECTDYTYLNIPSGLANDSEVQAMIDEEKAVVDPISSEVIGKGETYFNTAQLAKLFAKSIYDRIFETGSSYTAYQDVDYIIVNSARTSITPDSTTQNITYSQLFDSMPFDNGLYYATVTGENLATRLYYSSYKDYFYRADKTALKNDTTEYKIIIYDYLLYHISIDNNYGTYTKEYNYYPSANFNSLTLISNLSCRDCAKVEIKNSSPINSNNYMNQTYFDYSSLFQDIA